MNYSKLGGILGKIMILESGLMTAPLIVSFIYKEAFLNKLAHSTLFWRSFSHWIGGMGILVFVLIFIPESNKGYSMYLLQAESPGPQVGKIVSKMKVTNGILYLIYLGLTVLEVIVLMLDKPIPGYENEQFQQGGSKY